jgi:hypothetical protein
MTSELSHERASADSIPADLPSVPAGPPRSSLAALDRLRHRLRRLRLYDGIVTVGLVVVAAVVVSVALDYTLTLPAAVRALFLGAAVLVLGRAIYSFVIGPLSRRVSDRELAVLVEATNPELRQVLLTAVQLGDPRSETARHVSPELIGAVIAEAESRASEVERTPIFRLGRVARAGTALVFAAGTFLALGSAFPEHSGVWFRRNLLLGADRWPKSILLEDPRLPDAVAMGDDLRVEVRVVRGEPKIVQIVRVSEAGDDISIVMDREERASWDLRLESLGEAEERRPELRRVLGFSAQTPSEALDSGTGILVRGVSRVEADRLAAESTALGAGVVLEPHDVFVHTFRNVSEAIQFTVEGGDDRLGPFEVGVRIRPRIDLSQIRLRLQHPEYTGSSGEEIEQTHPHLRVPMGTRVTYRMASNVPVDEAYIVIESGTTGAGSSSSAGGAARRAITAPTTAASAAEPWPSPGAAALAVSEGRFFSGEFVVAASGRYWFELEDSLGFRSGKPDTFRIQAIEDRKPKVRIVEPSRAREEVSALARIPIRVEIEDDYGVRRAVIEGRYIAPGSDQAVPRSFDLPGFEDSESRRPQDAPKKSDVTLMLDVGVLGPGGGPPEAGGRFEFYALAEDFGVSSELGSPIDGDGAPGSAASDTTRRRSGNVGESQVHVIEFVDPDSLKRRITDDLMLVRDQLRQLDTRQEALRKNVQELQSSASLAGRLGPDDAAKLSRQRQDQGRITEGLDRQVAEVERVLVRLETNLIQDPKLERWVTRIRDQVSELARSKSPEVEKAIEELRQRSATENTPATEIAPIAEMQRRIERDLDRLVLLLEEFGDRNALIQQLRELRRRQEQVRDATRLRVEGAPGDVDKEESKESNP